DLENRRQTGGEFASSGNLEADARLGEGPFGPDDSLGDGWLRDEEGTRDLLGRQTSEQAERERGAGLGRENRMTGYEHETQEVVADVLIARGLEIPRRLLVPGLELVTEHRVLALEPRASAQQVDRAMLRGGHQPGARIVRYAR